MKTLGIILVGLIMGTNESPIGKNVGRWQAQGKDITENVKNGVGTISVPWDQDHALTKKEALAKLDQLWDQLSADQKKSREGAYAAAKRFVQGVTNADGMSPKELSPTGKKSFYDEEPSGGEMQIRIDVEIQSGKAFAADATQGKDVGTITATWADDIQLKKEKVKAEYKTSVGWNQNDPPDRTKGKALLDELGKEISGDNTVADKDGKIKKFDKDLPKKLDKENKEAFKALIDEAKKWIQGSCPAVGMNNPPGTNKKKVFQDKSGKRKITIEVTSGIAFPQ